MKKRVWNWLTLCVLLLCMSVPALAEDCFTIDVDTLNMDSLTSDDYVASFLSASAQGVRVKKYISDSSELAAPVRLTLTQMDSQTLLFDKDYGYQSGTFDSGVIYLPYVADRTIPYLVTLSVGDYVYAMPYMHLQARLIGNNACTYGVRLNDLSSALHGDWMMGTMVDLNALAGQGGITVDICASNRYVIGQAAVAMQGGSVSVSLSFDSRANVSVTSQSVGVVTNCAGFAAGAQPPFYAPGEWVDVSGSDSALIVLSLSVDYDPAGLPAFHYDPSSAALQGQLALWEQNCAAQDAGTGWNGDEAADPSVWTDSAGWTTNSGWVDNGGWVDDGSSGDTGWVDGGSGSPGDTGWVDGGSGSPGDTGWVDGGSDSPGDTGWVDGGSGSLGETGWVDGGSGSPGDTGWVDGGSGWNDQASFGF